MGSGRFYIGAALIFWVKALIWYIFMCVALATDTGDYKYDAIMGTLSCVLAAQMVNLAARSK